MANVSSNNLTTLYSGGGVNVRPTSAYGNANVVSLLNVGTDGGNTVTNIVATGNITIENITANGNITADYFIGNFVGNVTGTANFANYAGNVTVSSQPNITSVGTLVNVSATGNITSVSGVFIGNGSGLTNINGSNVNTVANANFAAFAGNVTNSAQPNITSLGTLTGLSSNGVVDFANAGNVNLGSNSNIHISGGAANYALITDGAGNLSWGQVANAITANFANYAGNVTVSAQPNITSVGNLVDLRINNNQIHLGTGAGLAGQGLLAIAIGPSAGTSSQGTGSLAVGINAGGLNQGGNSIAIGHDSGKTNQGIQSIAIGNNAGGSSQGANSIAVGVNAGGSSQGANSIAVGYYAGQISSAQQTIAIGTYAGWDLQQQGAVAIGVGAGMQAQGQYSVAIGQGAGNSALGNNSIILNGTGINLNQTTPNTFTVKPVRNANTANIMYYDSGTGEITYDLVSNFAGNVANFANFAGNVTVSAQPNITSLGTLSNLSVSGNISSGNANLGNIAIANFFSGDGYLLSNLTIGAGTQLVNGNSNVVVLANSNVTVGVGGVSNVLVATNTGLTIAETLTISNSANAVGIVNQISSGNIIIATASANTATYLLTTIYHPNNSTAYPGQRFIRSRGNVTTPTTAVTGDRISGRTGLLYNGVVNPIGVSETWTAVGTVNANANATWSGGQINWVTGNPTGDTANQSSLSWQNSLVFNNSGGVQLFPGNVPNSSLGQSTSALTITSYGLSTTDLAGVGGINQQKSRGDRQTLLSVQPGDSVGRQNFFGHNGTIYQASRPTSIFGIVDSSYVANATIIPLNMVIRTVSSSNTNVDTTFFGNRLTQLPGNINFSSSTANLFIGSGGQVALGIGAGNTSQGNSSLALGIGAAFNTQGEQSVALGYYAGANTQGQYSVAIGRQAGEFSQGANSFALGYGAGQTNQGNNSISFGWAAGYTGQGNNAIAIGALAGYANQATNSIILNATGGTVDQTTANTFTVKPVRVVGTANLMFYNNSSGEISYDLANNTTVGNANYAAYAGNVTIGAQSNITSVGTLTSLSVSGNTTTANLSVTGTANIANLQLNTFQEDVYAIGSTSGTITPDFNNGSIQSMTLTGSITMNSLANAIAGRSMTLVITQGGTGSYTLTSSMLYAGGSKTLSVAVGAKDIISVFYDGTTYFASLSKAYS